VVTCQLQVERRTGKVRRSETDVLTTVRHVQRNQLKVTNCPFLCHPMALYWSVQLTRCRLWWWEWWAEWPVVGRWKSAAVATTMLYRETFRRQMLRKLDSCWNWTAAETDAKRWLHRSSLPGERTRRDHFVVLQWFSTRDVSLRVWAVRFSSSET